MLLEIENLTMRFGGLVALDDISLGVAEGEIHGLIGPNGSGKTTIFNVTSGYYKPTNGAIRFQGDVVSGLSPHKITAKGLARTFQNLRLFRSMTVLEHLLVGMGHHADVRLWQILVDPVSVSKEEKAFTDKAMEILRLLQIDGFAEEQATSLPYGLQRRVEIARALATDPRIVLLDEPAAGLNETETAQLRDILFRIRDLGITVFLVEHDMKLVMGTCDVVSVLDYGKKIAEGTCEQVSSDPIVAEAYLGEEEEP